MEHSVHAAHSDMLDHSKVHSILCTGEVEPGSKGSWRGHVYPGIAFIVWGAWWAWNTAALYLWQRSSQQRGRPYRGRPWYPVPLKFLWYLEPALKVAVPCLAVTMELWMDHHSQYQYLYCPEGTKYAGRFALANLNNWQHALSYPGFVLSGVADMLGQAVPLPAGTSQAVLGSAFASSAFIMFTHEKHEPQDKMVHWLLAVAMLLSTLGVLWEMAARRNVLAGAAKSAALLLQGAWLVQIAAVEYEGRPQWSTDYPGGAMFASTVFALIATLCIASMLTFYVALALLARHGLLPLSVLLPSNGGGAVDEEDDEEAGEQVFRCHRKPHRHHGPHRYDSANHSDDNDSELLLSQGANGTADAHKHSSSRTGVAAFQIAHSRSDTADALV